MGQTPLSCGEPARPCRLLLLLLVLVAALLNVAMAVLAHR